MREKVGVKHLIVMSKKWNTTKYIISGVTTDQAIMFLLAEAIFAEINAYHTNIIK